LGPHPCTGAAGRVPAWCERTAYRRAAAGWATGRRQLGRDNGSVPGQVKTQSWPVRSVVFPRGEASASLHDRTPTRRSERLRPGDSSCSWPPITDRDLRAGTDRSRYVIGPGLERRAQSGQVRRWSSALRRPGPFITGRSGRPGSGLRSVFLTGRWPAADPARVVVIQPVRPGVVPGPVRRPGLPGSAAARPVTAVRRIAQPPGTRAGCCALPPAQAARDPDKCATPRRWPLSGCLSSVRRPGPVHAIASPSWLVGQGSGAALVPGSLPPRPR